MYEEFIGKKFICKTWKNAVIVEADIDLTGVIAIVKYNDHGDEFYVVKRVDGSVFEYGWYLNRKWYPNYSEVCLNPDRYVGDDKQFIIAPVLYYAQDMHCAAANRIYWLTRHLQENCDNESSAKYTQIAFDSYCDHVKEVFGGRFLSNSYGHTYHCDFTNDIETLLKKHDIYTQENIEKLTELKKFWRIDDIDGTAGMKKVINVVTGDAIEYVWYKGNILDTESFKVDEYSETEFPWGDFDRFDLDMDQFV